MLSIYPIVLTLFVSIFCSILLSSLTLSPVESIKRYDILPILDKVKDEPEFGVLHTLRKYSEWSAREEKLKTGFKSKLNLLQLERNSIQCLLLGKQRSSGRPKFTIGILEYSIHRRVTFFNDLLLSNMANNQKWVGSEDILMSMTGISYLQKIYLIPGEQISVGLSEESKFGGFLSQLDCAIIGLYSLIKRSFATAVNWLQTALLHVSQKGATDWTSIMFSIGIQIHNLRFVELTTKTNQSAEIVRKNGSVDDVYHTPILNGQLPPFQYSKKVLHFNTYRGIDTQARFTDLCQGNNLQSVHQKAKLYCYFENKKHPYLYINPVKVEQLSRDPLILQFYEIMSNSSMNTIQREIGPHVKSFNLFFDKDSVAQRNSPVRITNSARMGIRNFANVSNATYHLTGILSDLNILDHPNHNVLGEHVYGRHFNIHNDGLYKERSSDIPDDEDTIATMVFYLKLPSRGGCTAFLHAGVCSRKVVGSAIFWYNMYRNGTYTMKLTHGSCPVYHGNKIAISFFFQHNANWNKRLCSVNQWE